MPDISLTDFVDFTCKSGVSRMTKVRQIKNRPDYHPRFDYYRELREFLQELSQGHRTLDDFSNVLTHLKDETKIQNFREAFAGLKKYLGRKSLVFFEPPYHKWIYSDLNVRINPELRLLINGIQYVIKLYFKSEALSKQRIGVITHLMGISLNNKVSEESVMGILDIRRGKLHTNASSIPGLDIFLNSEAMAFLQLWEGL